MIIWNTKKLCDKIRSNGLSDNEKKNYLIVGTMLIFSMSCIGGVAGKASALEAAIKFLLLGTITVAGLQKAFQEYRPANVVRTSFLEYYAILGVPLGFKVILLSFGLCTIAGMILGFNALLNGHAYPSHQSLQIAARITEVVSVSWYYWCLVVFAKYISRTEAPASKDSHPFSEFP